MYEAEGARPAGRSVEAVWRIEAPRLVAGLTRMVGGDLGLAEDLAQDALVAALEQWPAEGVPRNPGAWLMTVVIPCRYSSMYDIEYRRSVE